MSMFRYSNVITADDMEMTTEELEDYSRGVLSAIRDGLEADSEVLLDLAVTFDWIYPHNEPKQQGMRVFIEGDVDAMLSALSAWHRFDDLGEIFDAEEVLADCVKIR